jgi:hypothetical protein
VTAQGSGKVIVIVMAVGAFGMASVTALAMTVAMSIGSPGPTLVQFLKPLLPSLFTAFLGIAAILLVERDWFIRAFLAAAISLAIIPLAAWIFMF